jgi:hypothetical protein
LGKVVGGVVGAAVLCSGVAFLWATRASSTRTARTFETHRVDLPVPFPLTDAARASPRAARATGALAEPAAPADPATVPGDPAATLAVPLAGRTSTRSPWSAPSRAASTSSRRATPASSATARTSAAAR